jgi:hypothetical protein
MANHQLTRKKADKSDDLAVGVQNLEQLVAALVSAQQVVPIQPDPGFFDSMPTANNNVLSNTYSVPSFWDLPEVSQSVSGNGDSAYKYW